MKQEKKSIKLLDTRELDILEKSLKPSPKFEKAKKIVASLKKQGTESLAHVK